MVNNFGKKVFIGGIGGISTSGIALFLISKGHIVVGSDPDEENEQVKLLKKLGVVVYHEQTAEIIKREKPDTYIFSYAIKEDCPERYMASKICKQVLGRGKALGLLAQNFGKVVAVSGSHGKTTTTSILSYIFSQAGIEPTVHIGGVAKNFDKNFVIGDSDVFITEACEYHNSFLNLFPFVSVILNVQNDHMDFFKTAENLNNAFFNFATNTLKNGFVCLNKDDPILRDFERRLAKEYSVKTFSLLDTSADAYAKNIHIDRCTSAICFDAVVFGESILDIKLNMVGRHNVYNALVGLMVAKLFNIDTALIKNALFTFSGIKRRYEIYGKINGATIIHDYAHHPTEIETVIKETRLHFGKKVVAVFEPHTYSRTKSLWKGFVKSLAVADRVILCPIYPAREKPIKGVTSYILSLSIKNYNKNSEYVKNYAELAERLASSVTDDSVVLILGAGTIVRFLDGGKIFDS